MAGNIAPEAAAAVRYTVLKLRLHPTPEQAALMEQTFGCCRYLWNRMLADAGEFYAATDLQYIPLQKGRPLSQGGGQPGPVRRPPGPAPGVP